jgi:hypothetical protein
MWNEIIILPLLLFDIEISYVFLIFDMQLCSFSHYNPFDLMKLMFGEDYKL